MVKTLKCDETRHILSKSFAIKYIPVPTQFAVINVMVFVLTVALMMYSELYLGNQNTHGYTVQVMFASLHKGELSGGDFMKEIWPTWLKANLSEQDLSDKPQNWSVRDPAQLDLLKGASLDFVDCKNAIAYGAFLARANLRKAHFERANLKYANLNGAKMVKAYLEETDFSWAHLEGADLSWAHLEGADLSKAHLEGADLSKAHLEGADLSGAHLKGADLSGAVLMKAKLEFVAFGKYSTAKGIKKTDLRFANLSGVTGLTQKQLSLALGNHSIKLPVGLKYPKQWK